MFESLLPDGSLFLKISGWMNGSPFPTVSSHIEKTRKIVQGSSTDFLDLM
jgi:hypothetical protein